MTVRELITTLLNDKNIDLDDNVEMYICGTVGEVGKFLEDAENRDSPWCFDDILPIEEIENRADIYGCKLKKSNIKVDK